MYFARCIIGSVVGLSSERRSCKRLFLPLRIVERRGNPKDGDIVIAEVDGGWTMKYFKRKGSLVYLKPANKNYSPIYPQYDLKVAAIVKGVIRKY